MSRLEGAASEGESSKTRRGALGGGAEEDDEMGDECFFLCGDMATERSWEWAMVAERQYVSVCWFN